MAVSSNQSQAHRAYQVLLVVLAALCVRSFSVQQLSTARTQTFLSSRQTIHDDNESSSNRRTALTTVVSCISLAGGGWVSPIRALGLSHVASSSTITSAIASDTREEIESARKTLGTLLENWERAVIDCTYADVPRELLEQRNKELLLEKAATSALFDKSASVTSCKTTNRVVRDYIGATGKGPVVGLEKKLRSALDLVDPDNLDDFVQIMENVEQALAKAKSLSYTAGVADFAAVNNFKEAEKGLMLSSDSNLEQARQSIAVVVEGLDKVLPLISESP
uniref:Uncharacterized protein n=1 Tax=Entomoneis paludosa TaxID=265537 RepID=A0A7S2Y1T1_9STRA|eukprot:CAMPEP_0172457064 /NCGR_PEP_ID=MMETSP1065-20121228/19766_1 /TAXON_ID=265537 /ORGANISM="Amphiprora paludosa, Strain CCMP125" /LENGTH=278 /DNA_ID=CAMNT_0013210545 /DNA_START=45 /DNA_END=881 /DNA_ORIENTATION=-